MTSLDSELKHSFEKLEFPKLIAYLKSLCQTEVGEKYFDAMPSFLDRAAVEAEYRLVGQAHLLVGKNVFPDLTGTKDVRISLERASKEGSFLAGKDLHEISFLLHVAESARKSLLKQRTDLPELSEIGFRLYSDRILEFNLNRAVDEEGNVRDDASKELARIRARLIHTRGALRKKIISIARSFSEMEYSEDDIFTQRDGRLVLPVKSEHKRQIQGLIHGSSATGQTVFIEPAPAVELNNEVISLLFEEQREIEKILKELTDKIRKVVPQLLQNVEVISYLDSLYARGMYSIRLNAIVPSISKVPRLVKARHPLLAIKLGNDKVVPTDMFLDDETRAVIISGPNSGGKTVTLKTIGLFGLCVISAIPLTGDPGTELPAYEKIFVDIGDDQSIEDNLSTFTSRVKHFVGVLSKADEHSLVLIDELGEETEPAEGAALSSAILEDLRDLGAMSFVTTHNSGLKVFASDTRGMLNAAMEFDQNTLTPTYKLVLGRPGSSYAFEIAQRTGITPNIITRARKYVGEGRDKLESLLLRIEQLENELRDRVIEIKKEQELAEKMRQEYEKRVHSAKKEASEIRNKAADEAEDIVSKLNTRIESLVREIRETKADRQTVKHARTEANAIAAEVAQLRVRQEGEKVGNFSIGDPVILTGTLMSGYVLERTNDKGNLVVDVNGLKLRVHESELKHASRSETSRREPLTEVTSGIETKVDIRGMRPYEIQSSVEKFIDNACLGGAKHVEIVHGMGTGALKRSVEQLLRDHPFVTSFRSGEIGEGGQGVTIVELKEE